MIVLERSDGICEMCGCKPIAHFYHCIFRSQLGTGEIENCLGLCVKCHERPHHDRKTREWCVEEAKRLSGA